MLNFNDFVNMSINAGKSTYYDCNVEVYCNNKLHKAYGVYVANRDLLFLCNGITVTYLVDTYGNKNIAELFDWNIEEPSTSEHSEYEFMAYID